LSPSGFKSGSAASLTFWPKYDYVFYITNDRESTAAEIVFAANDRCNQENVVVADQAAQLKGGVRALRAPVDSLLCNWAYMLMCSLAWNLKAWLHPRPGRWYQRHRAEQAQLLHMEFRTFVSSFMRIPCQIINTGRELVGHTARKSGNSSAARKTRLFALFHESTRWQGPRTHKRIHESWSPIGYGVP
jgi:hypothetical protein